MWVTIETENWVKFQTESTLLAARGRSGTVLGLLFITLMLDVGVLTGASVYMQGIVLQGVALILAVVVDIWSKRQMARH